MDTPNTFAPQIGPPPAAKPRRKFRPKLQKTKRKRKLERKKTVRAPLRAQLATDPDAILTFLEWCAINTLSERQGRRILTEPGGPVVTQLTERRIGISRRNNQLWVESRERGER
jgi:hypothetical protein